jgi:hypothetical protein
VQLTIGMGSRIVYLLKEMERESGESKKKKKEKKMG